MIILSDIFLAVTFQNAFSDPKPKSLKDFGGKKAIQQLECVNNLLVSLVDGVISAHKVEGELELMVF